MKYLSWRIRSFINRLRKPKNVVIHGPVSSVILLLNQSPFVHKSAYRGEFEPIETDFLLSHASEFECFINIGANAGWFALIAAKLGLRTIAVEPDEINFSLLQSNIATNKLANLEAHQVACSNVDGLSPLYGGNSGASLIRGWAGLPEEARQVRVLPFDKLHPAKDKDALIFIDVEGSELNVLQGMVAYLMDLQKCAMLIEITSMQHQPDGINHTRRETFELLLDLGFQASYFELDGSLRPYLDTNEEVAGVSFLFTKNYSPRHAFSRSSARTKKS